MLSMHLSLPPRGAWIEIMMAFINTLWLTSLPPRGAWIEICQALLFDRFGCRRSPHGERGLKYYVGLVKFGEHKSLPPRGAWIEILTAA